MPHKRLTNPVRVFEYFFDGLRKGRGRENILRLEVSAMRLLLYSGQLLTSGQPFVGKGFAQL